MGVKYIDMHLSTMAQNIRYGFFGDLDVAIIEVCQINEDGSLVPTTSVGNSPTFVSQAKKGYRRGKCISTIILSWYA